MDDRARIDMLEQENDALRERIAQLESALCGDDFALPIEWRLTGQEVIVMGVLLARELATKQAIMTALYSGRIDDGAEEKMVDVFICKIRKKLKPFGVAIETVWGRGYQVSAEIRARYGRSAQRVAA